MIGGRLMIDLETKAQLELLLTQCGYAIDRGDYDAIRRLYHPDAYDDHGAYKGDVEGLIAWFKEVQAGIESSAHTLINMHFAREGDLAESQSRGITYLRFKGDPSQNMMVVGRHFDRYERRDGAWKFIHRSLCVDWVQMFAPGAGGFDAADAADTGKRGLDDPFYSKLKLLPRTFKDK